ncbi:MAG: Uncharacterized protein K0S32_3110 [Bacteroidetes bacterium]|jgi:hypothetical protein|nr:Uncharacterized protein [Bacteroidota bacterium]
MLVFLIFVVYFLIFFFWKKYVLWRPSKPVIFLFLLTTFLFPSCKEEESKSVSITAAQDDKRLSPQPESPQDALLPAEVHCLETKETKFCLINKTKDPNTKTYSGANIYVQKHVKSNNEWKFESEHYVFEEEFDYCEFAKDFELVTIDGTDYLYFAYRLSPMGNATDYTNLHFVLLSLKDFKQTILQYGGEPVYDKKGADGKIKGECTNLASFKNKTSLLNFLQKKVTNSPMIYHPTEDDLDMCLAKNYREQWKLDNPDVDIYFPLFKKETPLRITYYDESIFPDKNSETFDFIENNKYRAVTLFRGDVLAYDKTKNKYFPVLVNECSHGCNKSISFKSENVLEIIYSEANNEKIIVDLSLMIYKGE